MGVLTLPAGDQRAALGIGALVHGEGAFMLPLLGAVQSALLSLVIVSGRDTSPSALKRALEQVRGPAVLLLDGDDYQPGAPSDWRCTRAALAWARLALVHGTAGARAHYETAVVAAVAKERLLVVHCASDEALAWAEATAAAHLCPLVLMPERGPHPLPFHTGTVQ
jgi:hypothetical protein